MPNKWPREWQEEWLAKTDPRATREWRENAMAGDHAKNAAMRQAKRERPYRVQ